jgi:hypothetical protein
MKRITNLFLAALVGFSALPFGSCKSEIDKAGKAVNESTEKAKEQTGRAMEKAGQDKRGWRENARAERQKRSNDIPIGPLSARQKKPPVRKLHQRLTF